MNDIKSERTKLGEKELEQVKLWAISRKQERLKQGITNYEDYWEEIDATITKWLNNPKLKEENKEIFNRLWLSCFKIYNELSDFHINNEVFDFEYYNRIIVEKEQEMKEISAAKYILYKKCMDLEVENETLRKNIKRLREIME